MAKATTPETATETPAQETAAFGMPQGTVIFFHGIEGREDVYKAIKHHVYETSDPLEIAFLRKQCLNKNGGNDLVEIK